MILGSSTAFLIVLQKVNINTNFYQNVMLGTPPKESDSLTPINQAVIISEGNVHHRPDHDLQCKRQIIMVKKSKINNSKMKK